MKHATITRNIHERMFGGGVQPSLTTSKRPGTGRRAGRKILSLGLVSIVLVTLLGGCGKNTSSTAEISQQTDYEVQKKIEQQLEDTALPKGFAVLLEDDFVTVICKDGGATVTVKASANFAIPYVAEKFLPVAQEAVEAAGVTLSEFDVDSYNTNKDGIVDGTWASWHTKDGNTGIFTDQTDGKTVVEQGWTIEQLYDHFSDYEDIVNDMIAEAGGGHE